MTRTELLSQIRTQLMGHPKANPQERRVDAPEVEIALEIGVTVREQSRRECGVVLLLENYRLAWHWRVVVQVGWNHVGKGEDRKSSPDCIGTPWQRLDKPEDIAAAVATAAMWLGQ